MKKGNISKTLRSLGLMHLTDNVRYSLQKMKNKKSNKEFLKSHTDIKLPPDYLMYESFQIDYKKYYTDSIETAKWLISHFEKHKGLHSINILDWGCGPGRIIRHMPELIGNNCNFFGTDYNRKSIDWCSKNIPEVEFSNNELAPPLSYTDDSMDVIYGISIFTHLSEEMHIAWYKELYRVLKKGGIMFLTTHGNNFKCKLTTDEVKSFDAGQLIIRGKVKEGHRTYTAYHPPAFMHHLFENATILEHIERESSPQYPQQDIWIIRK